MDSGALAGSLIGARSAADLELELRATVLDPVDCEALVTQIAHHFIAKVGRAKARAVVDSVERGFEELVRNAPGYVASIRGARRGVARSRIGAVRFDSLASLAARERAARRRRTQLVAALVGARTRAPRGSVRTPRRSPGAHRTARSKAASGVRGDPDPEPELHDQLRRETRPPHLRSFATASNGPESGSAWGR